MSHKRIPLALIGTALILSYILDPSPERLPRLAIFAVIGLITFIFRTRSQRVLGVLLCIVLLYIAVWPEMRAGIKEQISDEPSQHWDAPAGEVRLGGQQITFYGSNSGYILTVSYWLDDTRAVAAAHRVDGFSVGDTFRTQIIASGKVEELDAEIISNDSMGIAFQVDTSFAPSTDLFPIAGSDEIVVGEEAEIISIRGGSFPVVVKGFDEFTKHGTVIVIERINDSDDFISGMSGSPVVQNGKIIGLMNSTLRGDSEMAYCRLAAEVYTQTTTLMEE